MIWEERVMPPRPKFTRDELIKGALELAREGGLEAIVARNLGNKMNTAPSTILPILVLLRRFVRL